MKKLLLAAVLSFAVLVTSFAEPPVPNDPNTLRQELRPLYYSVTEIKCGTGGGSGVIYKVTDKNVYVLTARHVVEKKKPVAVKIRTTDNMFSIIEIERSKVYLSPRMDLAVLEIPKPVGEFSARPIAKDYPLRGDTAILMGHPSNLHYHLGIGIVTNYQKRKFDEDELMYLVTDAMAYPGNSGCPIVNDRLELVGIIVRIFYTGSHPVCHFAYAIPIDYLNEAINQAELYFKE